MSEPQKAFQTLHRTLSRVGGHHAHQTANVLCRADKFSFLGIPLDLIKAGMEFADQLNVFGLLRLPFPEVAFLIGPIEEEPGEETAELGRVYYMLPVCWQDGARICGQIFCVGQNGAVSGGATLISPPTGVALSEWREDAGYAALSDKVPSLWTHENTLTSVKLFGAWVMAALGCLNSEGLETKTTQAPKYINSARERKGKTPIFSLHHVAIDLTKVRMPGLKSADMAHASPRLHWRRGHIRRLAAGRMTIVRPCLVGDPQLGTISHDYRIRA